MNFLIADTFTDGLAKLTGDEQKQVKTTAFDLQMNPASPGMSFHKLDKARDRNFWSVRVSRDIRLIVHKSASSLLLCYVAHHDKAYQWAERRKLETHPKTGAAQLVEIRETFQEILVPNFVAGNALSVPEQIALFADIPEETLLAYGVPQEWLADVVSADEDLLLQLADHLPAEAAEALLELATGGQPPLPVAANPGTDPFEHPDAQRRFRVMTDADELACALDYPWEKWTIFLHPAQRQLVEKDYNGPARVAGSAGTGKTIVALHRAVHLARANSGARILLTTFSETLANALAGKLHRLISSEPQLGERLEVHALDVVAKRLYEAQWGPVKVVSRDQLESVIRQVSNAVEGIKFSQRFLLGEWEDVVDAWQLDGWEAYRDVKRLGRKTRLPEKQRTLLWGVFERVRGELQRHGWKTPAQIFNELATQLAQRRHPPFDYVVVDEAQDISVAQLRFLAAMGADRSNSLFFAGDLGQRIFQTPFSWKSLGVDIRGRSNTLRINYRTSHQIRMQADRLLGPDVADVDGNVEDRTGTVSVFNGPRPDIRVFSNSSEEAIAVGGWFKALAEDGMTPSEMGLFVRSSGQLERAQAAANASGLSFKLLDDRVETTSGKLSVGTMHLAKGLEFRAVAVMCCDDEIIPLQERIEAVADDADLQEVYETERHLLYVACTRSRDHLLVSSVDPASEFIDDLIG
jgi:mRNA-degrading endonuclease RelE of RelBE toxin-antitoxin system